MMLTHVNTPANDKLFIQSIEISTHHPAQKSCTLCGRVRRRREKPATESLQNAKGREKKNIFRICAYPSISEYHKQHPVNVCHLNAQV